jgi:hypothetical protein
LQIIQQIFFVEDAKHSPTMVKADVDPLIFLTSRPSNDLSIRHLPMTHHNLETCHSVMFASYHNMI